MNKNLKTKISLICGVGLISLGLIFSIFGLIFLISNLIFLMIPRFFVSSSELGGIFVSCGLGLIAIGVAGIAIWVSLKTDELVHSLSDLNFDEKIAAITGYTKNGDPSSLEQLKFDLEAVSHIQEYASPKQKYELHKIVDAYIEGLGPDDKNSKVVKDIREIMRKIEI
jgi:hypothetical protein